MHQERETGKANPRNPRKEIDKRRNAPDGGTRPTYKEPSPTVFSNSGGGPVMLDLVFLEKPNMLGSGIHAK